MKKIISIAFTLLVLTSLTGCNASDNSEKKDKKEEVSRNGVNISINGGDDISFPCYFDEILDQGLKARKSKEDKGKELLVGEVYSMRLEKKGSTVLRANVVLDKKSNKFDKAKVTRVSTDEDGDVSINGIKRNSTKKEVMERFSDYKLARYSDSEIATFTKGTISVSIYFKDVLEEWEYEDMSLEELPDNAKVKSVAISVGYRDDFPISTLVKSLKVDGKEKIKDIEKEWYMWNPEESNSEVSFTWQNGNSVTLTTSIKKSELIEMAKGIEFKDESNYLYFNDALNIYMFAFDDNDMLAYASFMNEDMLSNK